MTSSSKAPMSDEPEAAPARRHAKYDRLIAAAREIAAVPTAVAHPCDESSLKGALDAAAARMIQPILVGPEGKIRGVAQQFGLDIGTAVAATAVIRVTTMWFATIIGMLGLPFAMRAARRRSGIAEAAP